MLIIKTNNIDLKGKWNYKLDPKDEGVIGKWFETELGEDTLNLPGTLCENGVGEKLEIDNSLNPKSVRSLRAKYDYIGACWYQKKIVVPKDWDGKNIFINLERIILKSELWIDGKYVSNMSSLVVAHNYDITKFIKAGEEHTITILIDNRDTFYLSTYGHSYTNESQSIWNGIVGDISLYAEAKRFVEDLIIITAEDNSSILVKGSVENPSGEAGKGKITFEVKDEDTKQLVGKGNLEVEVSKGGNEFEYTLVIDEEVTPWDEFSTKLYTLTTKLECSDGVRSEKSTNFGFRNVKVVDRDILLNNKKIYLRGNLECCVHPLTGYPPCDVDYWVDLLKKVKSYGMNHLRFHSNCPPEAAFIAADKVGVYLQPEGPVWLDTWFMELGSHQEHYEFMPKEAERLIRKYSNHPSFVIFCNGNEFRGDFSILHDIVENSRKIRPDIIYTLTANYDRPLDSEDDIFISVESDKKGMRGNRFFEKMATTVQTDYSAAVETRNIPLIAHEGGQFCVYPNVKEIPNYNGNLVPMNFMAIEKALEEKDMLDMVDKFVEASGDFSARLYKEEIESYMRTMDFGGFQILGIQDFPGQCTATVGILDSFWNSKGIEIATPEWFREFCNDVVLLIKAEKRIYSTDDVFSAELMVNQFGHRDIDNANILYKFTNQKGEVLSQGVFENLDLKANKQIEIGKIENNDFGLFKEPTELTLSVEIENTEYKNHWNIWVYPNIENNIIEDKVNESDIKVCYQWDESVEEALENGEKVLLIPRRESFVNRPTYDSAFYTVFWSPVFFNRKTPCGIYVNESKAFENFVTGKYSNYQWYHLLQNSFNFDVDNLPKNFTPIIEAIPNYYFNHRLTNLIEARVGKGVLMICTIQLEDLKDCTEAKWFKYSLVDYLGKVDCADVKELTLEQARELIVSDTVLEVAEDVRLDEDFIN